jgi:predicted DNA-binding transcriptional regulator YafY
MEHLFDYNTNKRSCFGGDHMKMSIGQTIEMIYLDKAGKITQRKIEILEIRDGRIRATCLTTGSPRVFLVSSILSWRPVAEKRHAG